MLHDSFQAISSNNILHFNIPLHLLLKGRRKARSLTNQFSRMLCNTGSDWEREKKHHLVLSQETGIRSLSGYGRRVLKTDREKTILQNLQE